MLRRTILRIISVLFGFNAVTVFLLAFAAANVLSLPDAVAPLLVVSVMPLVVAGLVVRILESFLAPENPYGMAVACLCAAAFSATVAVSLWNGRPWALRIVSLNFGAAAALFAMALSSLFLPSDWSTFWPVAEPETWEDVLKFGLILGGMTTCILLSVYLLRAARAERGEYPAPEIGLSLRGK